MIILVLYQIGMAMGLVFGRKSTHLSTLCQGRHTWPIRRSAPSQPSASYDTSFVNVVMKKALSSDGKVIHLAVLPLPKRCGQLTLLQKQPHKIVACSTMADKADGSSDASDNTV
jgi:hypothetical protein